MKRKHPTSPPQKPWVSLKTYWAQKNDDKNRLHWEQSKGKDLDALVKDIQAELELDRQVAHLRSLIDQESDPFEER